MILIKFADTIVPDSLVGQKADILRLFMTVQWYNEFIPELNVLKNRFPAQTPLNQTGLHIKKLLLTANSVPR